MREVKVATGVIILIGSLINGDPQSLPAPIEQEAATRTRVMYIPIY